MALVVAVPGKLKIEDKSLPVLLNIQQSPLNFNSMFGKCKAESVMLNLNAW
jgi:hypothetical protein